MKKEHFIFTFINCLFAYLFTVDDWAIYIISDWGIQTIIIALLGSMIGSVIGIQNTVRKPIVWIVLGLTALFSLVFYSKILQELKLDFEMIAVELLLLFIFFVTTSIVIACFELIILNNFENARSQDRT